jgi:hypothetical protein
MKFFVSKDASKTGIELEKINEGKSSVSSVVTAKKSAHSQRIASS